MAGSPLQIRLRVDTGEAEASLKRFGDTGKAALDQLGAASDDAGKASDRLAIKTRALLEQLDPQFRATNQQIQATKLLTQARNAEVINLDQYTRAIQLLNGSLVSADAAGAAVVTTSRSMAGAFALNRIGMMELQASGINAFQALAAGMSPLRVATMEGAQVIGAFVQGGLSMSAVLGALTSPFTLAAVAAAALGGALLLLSRDTQQAISAEDALKRLQEDKSRVDGSHTDAIKALAKANDNYRASVDQVRKAEEDLQRQEGATLQAQIKTTAIRLAQSQQGGILSQLGAMSEPGAISPDITQSIQAQDAAIDKLLTDLRQTGDVGKFATEFTKLGDVSKDSRKAMLDLANAWLQATATAKGFGNATAESAKSTTAHTSALDEFIQKLEGDVAASQVAANQREALKAVTEASAAAQRDYNAGLRDSPLLTDQEAESVRKLAQAKYDAAQATEAQKKAEEVAKQAAAGAQRQRDQEQRKIEESVQHSTDRIVDFTADAFDKIEQGGKGAWQGIADSAAELMRKAIAQIAAEAIIRPVIQPIVAGVVGSFLGGAAGGVASGGGSSLLGTASNFFGLAGGANSLGLFGDTFSGIGSTVGGAFSAIGNGINSVGTSLGFAPSIANITGAGNIGAFTSEAALQGSASSSLFGGMTFGQFLGGAGLGFGAGSLLNGLLGGNAVGGTVGSGVGAAAGAAIGSIIPGVGTILGGLLGGALGGGIGGLFGNNHPHHYGANEALNLGDLTIASTGNEGSQNVGARDQLSQAFVAAARQILATTGGRGPSAIGQFGVDSVNGVVLQDFLGAKASFQDPAAALDEMTLRFAKSLTGVSSAMETAIQHTDDASKLLGNLGIAATVDQMSKVQPAANAARDAVEALGTQFDNLKSQADGLGIDTSHLADGFRATFDQQISDAILAIQDPLQATLNQDQQVWDARKQIAEKFGGDVTQVEKLNELERQQVIQQANQSTLDAMKQSADSLKSYLDKELLGTNSTLSPAAQLAEAQRQFGAALGGNDISAATQAADALLNAAKAYYATSSGYGATEAMVRSQLQLLGHGLGLPGFANGGTVVAGAFSGADSNLFVARTRPGERIDFTPPGQSRNGDVVAAIAALSGQLTEANRRLADQARELGMLRLQMKAAS